MVSHLITFTFILMTKNDLTISCKKKNTLNKSGMHINVDQGKTFCLEAGFIIWYSKQYELILRAPASALVIYPSLITTVTICIIVCKSLENNTEQVGNVESARVSIFLLVNHIWLYLMHAKCNECVCASFHSSPRLP